MNGNLSTSKLSILILAATLMALDLIGLVAPSASAAGPSGMTSQQAQAPFSPTAYTLQGDTTNSGTGVTSFSSTGGASGAWKFSTSSTDGIALLASCSSGTSCIGIKGTGNLKGVSGISSQTSGIGVFGQDVDSGGGYGVKGVGSYDGVLGVFQTSDSYMTGAGVEGDATSQNGIGVYGYSQKNIGGYFFTSSSQGIGLEGSSFGTGGYAIVSDGTLQVNGNFMATGTKSARVSTNEGDRLMYAEESTKNLFSDQGTAQLVNGRAVITIDPLFAQTVNLNDDYQVFLTPRSDDTMGLAVVNQTTTSFEVHELNHGHGTFRFDWRISALRKGYEKDRMDAAPAPPAPAPATGSRAAIVPAVQQPESSSDK